MPTLNKSEGGGHTSAPVDKEYQNKSYDLLVKLLGYTNNSPPCALFSRLSSLAKPPYTQRDVYETIRFLEDKIREILKHNRFEGDFHRINYISKMIQGEICFVHEQNKNNIVVDRLNADDYNNFLDMMQSDTNFSVKHHNQPVPEAVQKTREKLKDLW